MSPEKKFDENNNSSFSSERSNKSISRDLKKKILKLETDVVTNKTRLIKLQEEKIINLKEKIKNLESDVTVKKRIITMKV